MKLIFTYVSELMNEIKKLWTGICNVLIVIDFTLQGANKILFYYPAHEDENKKILNIGHIEAVICFTRYMQNLSIVLLYF